MRNISQEFDRIFPYGYIDKEKFEANIEKILFNNKYFNDENDIIEVESNQSSNKISNDKKPSNMEEINLRVSAKNELILKQRRNMLVFINPVGGKGKAIKIWNSVFLILGIIKNLNYNINIGILFPHLIYLSKAYKIRRIF